jgi:predicted Zn finger-like uncharacterized protein
MFTRCPACRTVFHITAAELRAADGTVVCGACDTTFDALDSLSETRPADSHEDDPEPSSPAKEDPLAPGEDARDEDEFLEEIESLIGDDGLAEELPDAGFHPVPIWPAAPAPGVRPAGALDDGMDDDPEGEIPDPDSVFRIDNPPDDLETVSAAPFVGDGDPDPGKPPKEGRPFSLHDEDEPTPEPAPEPAVAGEPGREASAAATGLEKTSGVGDDEAMPGFVHETGRGGRWLRVVLPLAAVLLLVGTWAHAQRGKLLRLPAGQALLGPVYSLLRMDVAPDWSPEKFRILRSEAIATADEPGDLRVALEFQNSAAFDQPFPIIRIVLLDRFGQRLGSHDVAPDRYRESHERDARLPAGGRARTSVAVPDPGARADGFRVDLCLELDDRGLVCAAEPFR